MIRAYANLSDLDRVLGNKSLAGIVVGISILMIFNTNMIHILIRIIQAAVILFTPYMLYVLYINEKKGWIFGFLIWMGISFLPLLFLTAESLIAIVLYYTPLFFYFLYCWVLKMKVGEWLLEENFWSHQPNSTKEI